MTGPRLEGWLLEEVDVELLEVKGVKTTWL